jgi:hypothetical protein
MRTAPLLLICACALALPATPAAATTSISGDASALQVTAGPGVSNQITVSRPGIAGTVRIADGADTLSIGSGCVLVYAGAADCEISGTLAADAGDGDDTIDAAASPVAVTLSGGGGNDRITGGALGDTIDGGAGADTLAGLGGDDTFHSRDGEADGLACGDGADDAAGADAQDSAGIDCEETVATAGAPDTSVASGPPAATRRTDAAFTFATTEPVSRYECSLDGAEFSGCSAETIFTGLPDGDHRLLVRAVDLIGNTDTEPASYGWAVDTQIPDVALITRPAAATDAGSADFAFIAGEPASTECRLDGGPWTPCDTPTSASYSGLGEGAHSFSVRATDPAGNTGTATFTWTVDRTAPTATLTSTPATLTNDSVHRFVLSLSETAAVFCNLDGGGWQRCSATPGFSGLPDGAHTLQLRSTDPAGNSSTVAFTWTQDTLRPHTELTAGPPASAPVNSSQATLTFASPDGTAFQCSLDAGAWEPCSSPKTYTGLAAGRHAFSVRAVDAAGNVDGTPVIRSWTVEINDAPVARIAVTRDQAGFTLDAGPSRDPEGGALTYRWLRNGAPAGTGRTIGYAAPDQVTRDVFALTVSDASGRQGQATVALFTRAETQTAAHEVMDVIRFGSGTGLAAGARSRLAALRPAASGAAEVLVAGHTRPSGTAAGQRSLSRARAQTVRGLLLKGIKAPRTVRLEARGAANPVASNVTAAGRARNDRVVVTVRYSAPAGRLVTEQEDDPAVRHSSAPQAAPAASGRAPKLFAFYSAVPGASRRLEEIGSRVEVLAPNWYAMSPATGRTTGSAPDRRVLGLSRRLGFEVWPVVNATMNGSALIESPSGRSAVVRHISALAARHRLDGVTLDMEEMRPGQQAAFSALVAQLASGLHAQRRRLAVYAVRRTAAGAGDSAAAYDWAALARSADLVLASGYNEHGAATAPGPVATSAGFSEVAQYAASVSRSRVAPTLGAIGYRWPSSGRGQMISSAEAERAWPVRAEVNSADGRSHGTGSTRAAFESAEDLWAREQAARRAGSQWIGLFSLGREPERFWERAAVR